MFVSCWGERGPMTRAVTAGSVRAQASAIVGSDRWRSAAAFSRFFRMVKVASLDRWPYQSGRSVIREPSGNGWSARYLPVSQPPARGL